MGDRMPARVLLKTYLDLRFLRLVTSFAEDAALAFGLAAPEARKLTLACEEIFAYLCGAGHADEEITVEAENGGYYVRLKFLFKAHQFDLRALNLTSTVSPGDAASLEEMGLLIAAKFVDDFHFAEDLQHGSGLVLIKEKAYPAPAGTELPVIGPVKDFHIASPDPEDLKLFVRLVTAHYPDHQYIESFRLPGKVVDMVASGEYDVKLAVGEQGQIAGGIVWRRLGAGTIESFGPYLFNQQADLGLSEELTASCIGQIARTDAIGLICRYATPELPGGYFESLGAINLVGQAGVPAPQTVYYRELREDPGCRVWAHPDLAGFLRAEYSRLFFTRDIQLAVHEGEQRSPHSIFAPQFDRANRRITLRPIWDGADAAANLAQHVKILSAEGLLNIFFEIDLACAWQAALTPVLLNNGFSPRLVLPYGGRADVVVFQHEGGE